MLDLPATDLLERAVQETYAHATGDKAAATDQAAWRRELGWSRDTIAATRPPGCWCLGLGGKRRISFPIYPLPPVSEPIMEWCYLVTCPACTEGRVAETAGAELRRRSTRSLRDRRLAEVLGDPALRDYQKAYIGTIEVDAANQAAFDLARRWADPGLALIGHSLLVTGDIGTGKTHLAVALMRQRIELGSSVWFVTLADLLQQIRDTYDAASDERTHDVLTRAWSVDLLVLDGIGDTGGELSEHDRGKLLVVLNTRAAAQAPILATTNLTGPQLRAFAGERVLSRLVGMCGGTVEAGGFILRWTGADRRMRGWRD